MKSIWLFLSFSLLLSLTGCSSEDTLVSDPEEEITPAKTITITVSMPDNDNKSRVSFDDQARSFTWDEGDCLTVIGYGAKGFLGSSEFKLNSGAGKKSATFIGKTVAGATDYVVYYQTPHLSFTDQPDGMKKAVFSYQGQSQNTRSSTAHLKEYLFIQSQRMGAEQFEKGKFGMKMQNSIMRFNILSTPADMGRIKSLEWENNRGTADAHTTALTLVSTGVDNQIDPFEDQGSTVIPMTLDARQSQEIVAFLCFDTEAMELKADQTLTVTFRGTDKNYRVDVTSAGGMAYKRGARYRANISTKPASGTLSNWQEIR